MKFTSQYKNFREKQAIDYSRQYEDTFIELEPYARNEKGEFLNDSPLPKLVKGEKVNIQERIQSFYEDCDLYHILERVALTGDMSLLDKKAGFYGDISSIPNNYNDINAYYKNLALQIKDMPEDLKTAVLNGASDEELEKIILSRQVDNVKDDVKDDVKNDDIKEEVKKDENK